MKPLIVVRPQPGCDSTVKAARDMGLDVRGFPLFEIRPMPWDTPEPDQIDALLIGSANTLRHGGAALLAFAGKPAYVVGEATASACQEAGLDVVATGSGGLQSVIEQLQPEHKRLLRLTGAKRLAVHAPSDVSIVERPVYASDPLPMPDALADLLRQSPAVVMLHSGEAAVHFRKECSQRGIEISRLEIAAIGPRVADAAGFGWSAVQAAEVPTDEALLALAQKMCQETAGPPKHETTQGPMQDQPVLSVTSPISVQRKSVRSQIGVAMLAFALGAAVVSWLVWQGYFNVLVPESAAPASEQASAETASETDAEGAKPVRDGEAQLAAISSVEARLAMLEDRYSRLDLQANAASGNAARAESLLIAFAARRMVERGEPLRYLSDQLRLRFANAQPNAVRTIIDFSKNPVTVDQLSARLEALGPNLAEESKKDDFWTSVRRDLSNMFTVRRESSAAMTTDARIERARVMLRAGRIAEAIEVVKRLPGADSATAWIADAQRLAEVQQALDLLETTAMLEPSKLQDAEGKTVNQPSPLATPVVKPTPAPSAIPEAPKAN